MVYCMSMIRTSTTINTNLLPVQRISNHFGPVFLLIRDVRLLLGSYISSQERPALYYHHHVSPTDGPSRNELLHSSLGRPSIKPKHVVLLHDVRPFTGLLTRISGRPLLSSPTPACDHFPPPKASHHGQVLVIPSRLPSSNISYRGINRWAVSLSIGTLPACGMSLCISSIQTHRQELLIYVRRAPFFLNGSGRSSFVIPDSPVPDKSFERLGPGASYLLEFCFMPSSEAIGGRHYASEGCRVVVKERCMADNRCITTIRPDYHAGSMPATRFTPQRGNEGTGSIPVDESLAHCNLIGRVAHRRAGWSARRTIWMSGGRRFESYRCSFSRIGTPREITKRTGWSVIQLSRLPFSHVGGRIVNSFVGHRLLYSHATFIPKVYFFNSLTPWTRWAPAA